MREEVEKLELEEEGGGGGGWVANDEHGEIQLRSTYVSFRG